MSDEAKQSSILTSWTIFPSTLTFAFIFLSLNISSGSFPFFPQSAANPFTGTSLLIPAPLLGGICAFIFIFISRHVPAAVQRAIIWCWVMVMRSVCVKHQVKLIRGEFTFMFKQYMPLCGGRSRLTVKFMQRHTMQHREGMLKRCLHRMT